ncbi:hypothetical protein C8F01DRAFT_1237864 [Mycena amicta]|nr:hypothetical protein C8F01DRAFT_1237864 [Mycena amicta]
MRTTRSGDCKSRAEGQPAPTAAPTCPTRPSLSSVSRSLKGRAYRSLKSKRAAQQNLIHGTRRQNQSRGKVVPQEDAEETKSSPTARRLALYARLGTMGEHGVSPLQPENDLKLEEVSSRNDVVEVDKALSYHEALRRAAEERRRLGRVILRSGQLEVSTGSLGQEIAKLRLNAAIEGVFQNVDIRGTHAQFRGTEASRHAYTSRRKWVLDAPEYGPRQDAFAVGPDVRNYGKVVDSKSR